VVGPVTPPITGTALRAETRNIVTHCANPGRLRWAVARPSTPNQTTQRGRPLAGRTLCPVTGRAGRAMAGRSALAMPSRIGCDRLFSAERDELKLDDVEVPEYHCGVSEGFLLVPDAGVLDAEFIEPGYPGGQLIAAGNAERAMV
jgi:hypothetical protein